MIDRIIGYDGYGHTIWYSDVHWWEEFIGYEKSNGEIVIYDLTILQ